MTSIYSTIIINVLVTLPGGPTVGDWTPDSVCSVKSSLTIKEIYTIYLPTRRFGTAVLTQNFVRPPGTLYDSSDNMTDP